MKGVLASEDFENISVPLTPANGALLARSWIDGSNTGHEEFCLRAKGRNSGSRFGLRHIWKQISGSYSSGESACGFE
jgi:hypothetical protein